MIGAGKILVDEVVFEIRYLVLKTTDFFILLQPGNSLA
jgi:hypothetical protein